METRFADVNLAKKTAKTARTASAMSNAEAICQEFCEKVMVGSTLHCINQSSLADQPLEFESVEELKCLLDIEHFTGLVERMIQEGYCCTQVQNDKERKKCVAWFEPMNLD